MTWRCFPAPREPEELAVAVGIPLWNPRYVPAPEDGQAGFLRFDDRSPFMISPAPLSGGCLSLAVQDGGSLIAWGTSSGDVVVMDRLSGRHFSTIALKSPVLCLRFIPGNRLISSHKDGRLQVLDPLTGKQVREIDSRTKSNCIFAVNSSGTLLACGGHNKILHFIELSSGNPMGDPIRHPSDVTSLAFSPDGSMLLSGGVDGSILTWDSATRQEIRRLADHSGPIYAIAFRQDGKMFASGGADRVVRLWEVGQAKPARLYRGHFATVRSLVFSRDGLRLASGSQDKTLRMWDAAVDPRGLVLPFAYNLNAIAFDETRSPLVIRADHTEGGIAAWSIPQGEKLSEFVLPPQGRPLYPIRYADFLNRGRTLAAVSHADPRTLMFADAATGQLLKRDIAVHRAIHTLAADPSGRWLIWAESEVDNEVRVRRWDEQTQIECEPIRLNVQRVRSLAFDPAHSWIAAVVDQPGSDGSLWIIDTTGRESPRQLCRAESLKGGLAFNSRADLLAAAVDDKINIYRTETWELLHRVPSLASITGLAFNADDTRLAGVGYDGVVILADPATGTRILQLRSPVPNRPDDKACDARAAFSSDGNWLLSSNWNGSLNIWNGSPIQIPQDSSANK